MPEFRVLAQCVRVSTPDHFAAFNQGVVIGELDQALNVFINDQNTLALSAKCSQAIPNVFPNQRR
jgi:ABC-type lipoprotein release transport system permease subunit